MKRYRAIISPEAQRAIEASFEYIHCNSPRNAIKWVEGLYEAVDTLETMPERCGLIRENEAFDVDMRELLYQSHRIIFTVNEEVVRIVFVRHAARDGLQ